MEIDKTEMNLIFQQMDLDGNGSIDFEEFSTGLVRTCQRLELHALLSAIDLVHV